MEILFETFEQFLINEDNTNEQSFENVTLCLSGTFGVNQIQCKSVKIKIRKYAQYNNAIELKYIPKGKKKELGVILTSNPYLVILEGFVNIENQTYDEIEKDDKFTISQSKHLSFSKEYTKDFDKMLDSSKVKILLDYRNFNTK